MEFNHYFTNEEIEHQLKKWVKTYPELATLQSIGESFEHRPMWLLTITQQKTGPDTEKPAIWIDANIHATELAGTTTALYIAHNLLTRYGSDPGLSRLLDTCTFYIAPRVNPDGAALAMAAAPRYVRSGVRPYPYTDKSEGLYEEDIDGDGRIVQMRIPDPNGDWKISSLDPRLMEKRRADENGGQYYRVLAEGRIEDYDGYLIRMARPYQGLDFNRNFPFEWRSEGEQAGAGPFPASEPEIKALVDFVANHSNISVAITYHTFAGAILRPYSTKSDDDMIFEDLLVFRLLGQRGTDLTGYRAVSTFHDFKYHPKEVTTGAFDDWMYDHRGVFSFTIELWDLPTQAGIKDRKFIEWYIEHPHEEDVQILHWLDENVGKEGYVDWYPYNHPQLGPVELGGWNMMYTWRNPPLNWIGKEAERNLPFVLSLAEMLPHLSIHTLKATPLGNDDYHLDLVFENTGFFPTYTSQQGRNCKAVRPVRVELDLPEGVTLVTGKHRTEAGYLEGRSQRMSKIALWEFSPTDNRSHLEWTLHADRQVAKPGRLDVIVHIYGERAGGLHQEVPLENA